MVLWDQRLLLLLLLLAIEVTRRRLIVDGSDSLAPSDRWRGSVVEREIDSDLLLVWIDGLVLLSIALCWDR
jgi:hypothetical protein